jgi:hypothetical protein
MFNQAMVTSRGTRFALVLLVAILGLSGCSHRWVDRHGDRSSAISESKDSCLGRLLVYVGKTYIENPELGTNTAYFPTPYLERAPLPEDARATGFHSGGRTLWLSPSHPDVAYLVSDGAATRLPWWHGQVACA